MMIFNQNITIPLWKETIPNYREVGEKNTVDFDDSDNLEFYSIVVKPEISVFLPSAKNRNGRAVLVIPGGGYNVVAHKWEGEDIAKWLNSYGISAFVLKYRLPHAKSNIVPHISPLIDAIRAMKQIRSNAVDWGIDKNNIGVMGFSAGGHLASTLGTHFDEKIYEFTDDIDKYSARPDFMVLDYPVISMSENFTHKGSRFFLLGEKPSVELMNYFSNEKNIKNNTPPTFLVHASDDKVVDVENSIAFYRGLRKKNIDAELHIFQNGGHAFALANGSEAAEAWKKLCLEWLNK